MKLILVLYSFLLPQSPVGETLSAAIASVHDGSLVPISITSNDTNEDAYCQFTASHVGSFIGEWSDAFAFSAPDTLPRYRHGRSRKGQQSENFFVFFQDFCRDSSFQIARIKFPLISLYPDPGLDSIVTETIKQAEWHFLPIKDFTSNTFEYFFDGFSHRDLPQSDEMVYAIIGIGNGIQINYYFKRIEGKWFLLKIEDLSS